MKWGGIWSSAWGDIQDQILHIVADELIPGVMRVRAYPMGKYRSKFYAFFVNGIYTGENFEAPLIGPVEGSFNLTPGTIVGSIYMEDAGDFPAFNEFIPDGYAEVHDAVTAQRLQITFNSTYTLTGVFGDTQLSLITITGAKRGLNVERDEFYTTRGSLSYSITNVSGTYIVRWFAAGKLVAEGSRVGNGALTCSQMNESGLSVACTLTFTAELDPGVAYLEIRWPSAYQIHYSTGALAYPRTPEFTVDDTGSDSYIYLTPNLASGTYNVGVVTVDDAGVAQTSSIPNESKVINTAPLPPTITSITGTAAALTVNFTNGEAGCTYTVYASLVNEPINLGNYALPAPVVTGIDATSAVLAAVTGYASVDRQAAIDTLFAAFDAAVTTCNASFTQAAFTAAFTTLKTSLRSAVNAYGNSLELKMTPFLDAIEKIGLNVLQYQASLPTLTLTRWQNIMGQVYGDFLAYLGSMLDLEPGRYTLPNGAIGTGALGGAALGTGASSDGSAGIVDTTLGLSLREAADPVVVTGKIRVVVRATKGGIEEMQDSAYIVEFDNAGAIVTARPNEAFIQTVSNDGLLVSARGTVFNDDAEIQATHLDLYVVAAASPAGSTINLAVPQSSVALGSPVFNVQAASLTYTVAASGWYDIAIVARAGTSRSQNYKVKTVYLSNTAPGAVTDFVVKVIRGRGAVNG